MLIDPTDVLSLYPPIHHSPAKPLEKQSTGWSGGAVWRVHGEGTDFALRLWPREYPEGRIHAIHEAQRCARNKGCHFIPQIVPAKNGSELLVHEGRHWELTDWMPGEPALKKGPTEEQLRLAATAIARWHQVLSPSPSPIGINSLSTAEMFMAFRAARPANSPGLMRRIAEWRRLVPLIENGHSSGLPKEIVFLTERTKSFIPGVLSSLHVLEGWSSQPLQVVVSLPDLHREHVLFSQGRVSGIIDLGGMTIDSPALDIARYGSSFDAKETSLRDVVGLMLSAYREIRPFHESLEELIISIARVSTAIGAMHWWEWLTRTNSVLPDRRASALHRWEELIRQVEMKGEFGV